MVIAELLFNDDPRYLRDIKDNNLKSLFPLLKRGTHVGCK